MSETAITRQGRRFTVDVEMTDREADEFFTVLADLAIDYEPSGVDASVSMGPAPACLTCEDVGWITVPDHACGGNDRICAEACPAPTQARCPGCDTEDNDPVGDGEDPF